MTWLVKKTSFVGLARKGEVDQWLNGQVQLSRNAAAGLSIRLKFCAKGYYE